MCKRCAVIVLAMISVQKSSALLASNGGNMQNAATGLDSASQPTGHVSMGGQLLVGDHMAAVMSVQHTWAVREQQQQQHLQSADTDGHIGTLCCCALLNLSRYPAAQVHACAVCVLL